MPDALELPGVRCAVIPLMRAGDTVVHELVPHWLPRLAPVVGALDLLPKPAAGLRRIQPMRVSGRSLEVVDLPAAKVGATDIPPCALGVRSQNERALACPNEYPYRAHPLLLICKPCWSWHELLPVQAEACPHYRFTFICARRRSSCSLS